MIELRHLTVGYGEKAVLRDISHTISTGQMVCLLGANGAGKSTVLRTLAGFLPPLSGEVLLEGHDLLSLSLLRRSRAVSVVLTEHVEVPYMRVADLVGMGRSPYTGFFGTLGKEDKRIVEEAIDMVGIGNLAGRTIDTLSDGERQKAMLAKALAQQTPVILLDEPTAFLDFPSKVEMMQLLRRLAREQQKVIFLSTHDFELALQVADMLWLMETGSISIGTPRMLADSGALARYVERPGITFNKETLTVRVFEE